MEFIEMTGKTLMQLVDANEFTPEQLRAVGVTDDSLVRINRQGDIELRKPKGWDIIGGLIGDFEHRVTKATGLHWAASMPSQREEPC